MTEHQSKRLTPLSLDRLPSSLWTVRMPIRFGHCDPAGIVFTPRYFDILNEAVEQFFCAALAIDYYALVGERRIGLGYAQASCTFFKPSRMGEVLEVAVIVDHVGGASYRLVLPVFKAREEVVRGHVVTVVTSLDTLRPRSIPDDVRTALSAYADRCRPGWHVA